MFSSLILDSNPVSVHPILTRPESDRFLKSNNNINNANRAPQRVKKEKKSLTECRQNRMLLYARSKKPKVPVNHGVF